MLLPLCLLACNDNTGSSQPINVPIPRDALVRDARVPPDMATGRDGGLDRGLAVDMDLLDQGTLDRGSHDMATAADMTATRDMAAARDMATRDMALPPPDMAPLDMPPLDMAPPPLDMALPPPRFPPCTQGPGVSLFAVHWSGGGESADVDHWHAHCDYSIRINDACGAFPRCGDAIANCGVAVVDQGQGLLLDGIDDLLFRFNVQGIGFSAATLYFQARGTRGGGTLEVYAPIYGGLQGPVGGANYEWYAVDWSDFLTPFDDPGVTGIRFRAQNSTIAIHAVEVCLQVP